MDDTKKLKLTSGACTGYGEWNGTRDTWNKNDHGQGTRQKMTRITNLRPNILISQKAKDVPN